uniref:Uncharacterized protein n=1 Tax=Arundo donax TaxID=35708 RepID=A0A0A9GTZ0_ARUDO
MLSVPNMGLANTTLQSKMAPVNLGNIFP